MIELIVAMSIFAVVTGVVLYNYSQFNTNILVNNLAYDVGLSIREAQVYGVSVRERTAGSNDFSSSYGIHFEQNLPSSLLLFSDLVGGTPNRYDSSVGGGAQDELIDRRTLPNQYTFANFCGILPAVGEAESQRDCLQGGDRTITSLDITFTRPEPDAHIKTSRNDVDSSTVYEGATVCLRSPLGKEREIDVASTGQISLSNSTSTCE